MVRCGWIDIVPVAIAALFCVQSLAEKSIESVTSFDTAIEKLLGGPFLPFPSEEELMESNRYSCIDDAEKPPKKALNIRGTSLGGWLVLEPWITPSLFYQFLGATDSVGRFQGNVAIDSYTFCEVLGGKEANRQLRIHWRYWVTERQIRNLAELGLNTVRIPIADWMFAPYYPFTNGCWEGALEELDRAIDLCQKYGLDVLLDMHAVRGSQVSASGRLKRVGCVLPSPVCFVSFRTAWTTAATLGITNGSTGPTTGELIVAMRGPCRC